MNIISHHPIRCGDEQDIKREQPPHGLLVPSDRGGQYVDAGFCVLLAAYGLEQSMSRAGGTYDNLFAEKPLFTLQNGTA